ncbi:hypothetical protein [Amycolatopsis sp. NPDC004079]|uniref:hypothetical protein n=1 Tax=Amycolatopsis sp. NPDC004079 TaxID=3154549 RepID=UPI0033A755EA
MDSVAPAAQADEDDRQRVLEACQEASRHLVANLPEQVRSSLGPMMAGAARRDPVAAAPTPSRHTVAVGKRIASTPTARKHC